MKKKFQTIGIVAAATIGTGVFALPYVIEQSGWFVSICYFIALTAAVSVAHILYLRTLWSVGEKERLLGLAKRYFGDTGFWTGFFAVVVGLLLSFVAYLVLGSQLVRVLIPVVSPPFALALFWIMITALIFRSGGKVAGLELGGVTLISCIILFVFVSGHPFRAFMTVPPINLDHLFLPFGAALFSLAGWTSVEQIYETNSKEKDSGLRGTFPLFVAGATLVSILYWLFAMGVLGSSPHVAMDTISGMAGWPLSKKDTLAVIGILAIGIVSIPLAREIRGALEKDLKWNSFLSRALIATLPLAVVLGGFNNFLVIVSVAGGIFIGAQYLLIIFVGRHALSLSRSEKLLLDALALVFISAAVYEIYTFVVR